MKRSILIMLICISAACAQPVPKSSIKSKKNNHSSMPVQKMPSHQLGTEEPENTYFAVEQTESLQLFDIDVETKKKNIVYLVKDGIEYLTSHRPAQAFDAFMNNARFTQGDVSLFVLDTQGTLYVPEQRLNEPWDNIKDYKNEHGVEIYKAIIEKAIAGGGWVEYGRLNDFKSSYVEMLEKNGTTYVIGAGWYPSSKKVEVENLVEAAVAYFNTQGLKKAFETFSNPTGQFVQGDLYISVYDLKGTCLAHGDDQTFIGKNFFDVKDEKGFHIIQAMIEKAQQGGGWIPHRAGKVPKINYVQQVTDANGSYVISSGYYPEINRTSVAFLVKRAVKYFFAWGREKSVKDFAQPDGEFAFGNLNLFMFNFDGTILSQPDNPEFVGRNITEVGPKDAQQVLQRMIAVVEKGGGWVSFEWKNDFLLAYVEKVSDANGHYILGSGYFPDTKRQKVEQMVKRAVSYLNNHALPEAMNMFKDPASEFIRGDREIMVVNMNGDCLGAGRSQALTWRNIKDAQDKRGNNVFNLMSHQASLGGGWISYISRNDTKWVYVEKIIKDGVAYLVSSGFYK